jgi:hypothetical protein
VKFGGSNNVSVLFEFAYHCSNCFLPSSVNFFRLAGVTALLTLTDDIFDNLYYAQNETKQKSYQSQLTRITFSTYNNTVRQLQKNTRMGAFNAPAVVSQNGV